MCSIASQIRIVAQNILQLALVAPGIAEQQFWFPVGPTHDFVTLGQAVFIHKEFASLLLLSHFEIFLHAFGSWFRIAFFPANSNDGSCM